MLKLGACIIGENLPYFHCILPFPRMRVDPTRELREAVGDA